MINISIKNRLIELRENILYLFVCHDCRYRCAGAEVRRGIFRRNDVTHRDENNRDRHDTRTCKGYSQNTKHSLNVHLIKLRSCAESYSPQSLQLKSASCLQMPHRLRRRDTSKHNADYKGHTVRLSNWTFRGMYQLLRRPFLWSYCDTYMDISPGAEGHRRQGADVRVFDTFRLQFIRCVHSVHWPGMTSSFRVHRQISLFIFPEVKRLTKIISRTAT